MKAKYYLYVFLLLAVLQSSQVFSQNNLASSYFPLAIGNKWIYKCSNPLYPRGDSIAIIDTQRVNGKLYWAVSEGVYRYNWFRQDGNNIYIIDTTSMNLNFSNFREYLVYDFSATVGHKWQIPLMNVNNICDYGGTVTLSNKSDSVITSQKVFENCYSFSRTLLCRDGGRPQEWFFSGIGRVAFDIETLHGREKMLLIYSNVLTDIENKNNSPVLGEYKLYQNYPNPFNPSTVISYQLPVAGNVSLKVYDILGCEVATLVNEFKEAGTYNSLFSILNLPAARQGSQFPSGLYFYRLTAGSNSIVKKMLLIK